MYSAQLTWFVHLGKQDSSDSEVTGNISQIGVFVKMIELPFKPYVGLAATDGKFRTPPIKFVTFDLQTEEFSCQFEDDQTIPTGAQEVANGKNVDCPPSKIHDYVAVRSKHRINELTGIGWEYTGVL